MAVEVDAGRVAAAPDRLAEGHRAVGERGGVPVVGARVLRALDLFPVEDHRQRYVVAIQPLHDEAGLLHGLLHVHGLGEEVDAHLQAASQRALDVALEPGVLEQAALGPAAAPHADHREVHARGGDPVPVHLVLVLGHIDAADGGVAIAHVGQMAVFLTEILPRQGARGDALQRSHPNPVKAVVDIDLPGVGVRRLFGPAGKEPPRDQRHQGDQHQKQHRKAYTISYRSFHRSPRNRPLIRQNCSISAASFQSGERRQKNENWC